MAAKTEKKPKKEKEAAAPKGKAPPPRLWTKYEKEILPELAKTIGRDNRLSLPRLEKIVVNMGVGTAITEKKHMEEAVAALSQITGQKPSIRRARKAIANFRLREGLEIGAKVTLRGARMYEFLDRLVSIALPRVRDFRGLNPDAFDGHGNYSLGLSEQLVFPELNPDKFIRPQGMNITMVTSVESNDEARLLLRGFGVPFKTDEKAKTGAA
ncbi:MAG TPA: 50S ribosomal protein L5 [Pirellulales bacterium]|jgi:large subunit ribosomal protein L5|nr:50S ribosomal protein L5 [Pirellulales bacterium]